jgi:EmrB/QacA subfamily drug resistance transporter
MPAQDQPPAPTKDTAPAITATTRLVTFALMLAMSVAALEQTVVSTAMPSIISELKGVRIYPWVFSAYLIAFTISTPLYGKLADMLGRKRVLLFGLGLFLVGSALSGLSWSMPVLIAMRIVQGLGFGAIMPIVLTIIGDLFNLHDRARVQGWFSAVWATAGLLGPAIGGYLTDYASWRWVFFVTLPFGAFAMVVLALVYKERLDRHPDAKIDWLGAMFLGATTSALLLAMLGPGNWPPTVRAAFWFGAASFLVAFILRERYAADPILPVDLLNNRVVVAALMGSFVVGALLFVIEVYLPVYVQGVRGLSALDSGKQLTPLLVSWSLSVMIAARAVIRFGFRRAAATGSVLIAIGVLAIAWGMSRTYWNPWLFYGGMIIIGLGMGPASLSYILSVQNAVPWNRRGVSTGALSYFRTMGGSLVVAAFGALIAAQMSTQLPGRIDVSAALRPETHHELTRGDLARVRNALNSSLRSVFFGTALVAAAGLVCALNLPVRAIPQEHAP